METNKCQLSIVIPVFNGSNEINICLDSIYSQGMSPEQFEVICVDDCSSDSTVEVIEDICKSDAAWKSKNYPS